MAEFFDASKIDWGKRYKAKKQKRGYGKMMFEKKVKEWQKKNGITGSS